MLFQGKTFSISPVKAFLLHMKNLKSHWLWRKNKPEQLFKYSAQGAEVKEEVLNGTSYYLEYLLINPSRHSWKVEISFGTVTGNPEALTARLRNALHSSTALGFLEIQGTFTLAI